MCYPKLALPILLTLGFSASAFAANSGTDNAAQPAYDTGGVWENGSNGEATGDAFLPWSLATSGTGYAGFFIGDSTTLDSPGADINTSGSSWGIYANGDSTTPESASAQRNFTADGSTVSGLDVGQTFSIDIAVNYNSGGDKGLNLLDSNGDTLFDLNIGEGAYAVNNATTGNGNLADQNYSSDTAFALTFTQTSLTSGTWTIVRSGGETDTDGGTYTGDAAGIKLYVTDTTTNGPQDDFFANNLAITGAAVPEPATLGLLACGTGVLLLWKRSRRRTA
ncbi:MAG TPA: PEP-CTERM sorting domain-containing protein [Chthoniobacteraceae bacterium]|jgi:hypothetical protein|nr:PEP-CTERM sorting domain-containing protein [Chthoniobacteraceae bacterium]